MKETLIRGPSEFSAPDICNRIDYPGCPFLGDEKRGKTKNENGIVELKNCTHPERIAGDEMKLHCIQNPPRMTSRNLQALRMLFKVHGGRPEQMGPKAWILYMSDNFGPLRPQLLATEDKNIVCR